MERVSISSLKTAVIITAFFALLVAVGVSQAYAAERTCPTLTRTLQFGTYSRDVIDLQKFLAQEGYLTSSSPSYTSYFGPLTQAAIQKFQKAKGIVSYGTPASTGYGAAGKRTRAAIASSCGSGMTTFNPMDATPVPTYAWQTGGWSACTNSSQTRAVSCVSSSNTAAADTLCVQAKPTTIQYCSSANANESCTFNTQTIAHGASVTAYASSITNGSQCVSEQRICENGMLGGSYMYSNCSVPGTQCVLPNPSTETHIIACQSGQTGTITQTKTASCAAGSVTPVWGAWVTTTSNCATPQPQANSCTLDGLTISHNASQVFYASRTVPSGQTCSSQTRMCTNGTLSGSASYQYANCSVTDPIVVTPTLSLSANSTSITSGSSATLTWTSTGMSSCGLYKGTSAPYTTVASSLNGSISTGALSSGQTYSFWCNPSDGSAAMSSGVNITIANPTNPNTYYKMSDYWPKITVGENQIRHFDNGLVDLYYAETTIPEYTYNKVDYLNGVVLSLWRMRVNETTGAVDEVGDYIPTGGTWYDPSKPIIHGAMMKVGDTQSADAGTVNEVITLRRHYDTVEFNGKTYADVIEMNHIQTAPGLDVRVNYFLQRGFGIIRTDVYQTTFNSPGIWTLTKHCKTTTAGQLTCP